MTTVRFESPISNAAHALVCASLGWRVMPLRRDKNRPALKGWPSLATSDPDVILGWWMPAWSSFAYNPVGILTGIESGIWVLDIDVKNGPGFTSLRDLFHRHSVTEIPRTLRAETPSGGQHWYFRYPDDGRKIKNISTGSRPGPLGPCLDVRGWHGMVAAPGTMSRPILDLSEPTDAPDWLVELATARPHERSEHPASVNTDLALALVERLAGRLAGTGSGRNQLLNDSAFELGLVGAGGVLAEGTARELLLNACRVNGLFDDPDDGPEQCEATFESGWNAGIAAGLGAGA